MKQRWYLVILIFVVPIFLNYFMLLHSPIDIVGDSEIWLSFWGSYLASLVTLVVLLFTLNQQIHLYKVESYERKIQNLLTNFKENFDFVRVMDVHRNIKLIKDHEYKEARLFFYNEIQKCLTKLSMIKLDFNDIDTVEYKNIFSLQCKAYAALINHAIRIIEFSYVETLDLKKSKFNDCEGTGSGMKLFTPQECEKIINSCSEEEFISTLNTSLDKRFNSFMDKTYPDTQKELIEISNKIIGKFEGLVRKV